MTHVPIRPDVGSEGAPCSVRITERPGDEAHWDEFYEALDS